MDLGIRDQDGFSAADLAEYNGHHQCAKYLRTVENMVRYSIRHTILNKGFTTKEMLNSHQICSHISIYILSTTKSANIFFPGNLLLLIHIKFLLCAKDFSHILSTVPFYKCKTYN